MFKYSYIDAICSEAKRARLNHFKHAIVINCGRWLDWHLHSQEKRLHRKFLIGKVITRDKEHGFRELKINFSKLSMCASCVREISKGRSMYYIKTRDRDLQKTHSSTWNIKKEGMANTKRPGSLLHTYMAHKKNTRDESPKINLFDHAKGHYMHERWAKMRKKRRMQIKRAVQRERDFWLSVIAGSLDLEKSRIKEHITCF